MRLCWWHNRIGGLWPVLIGAQAKRANFRLKLLWAQLGTFKQLKLRKFSQTSSKFPITRVLSPTIRQKSISGLLVGFIAPTGTCFLLVLPSRGFFLFFFSCSPTVFCFSTLGVIRSELQSGFIVSRHEKFKTSFVERICLRISMAPNQMSNFASLWLQLDAMFDNFSKHFATHSGCTFRCEAQESLIAVAITARPCVIGFVSNKFEHKLIRPSENTFDESRSSSRCGEKQTTVVYGRWLSKVRTRHQRKSTFFS